MKLLGLRWGDGVIVAVATVLVVFSFYAVYTPGIGMPGSVPGSATQSVLQITQAGHRPQDVSLRPDRHITLQGPAGSTTIEIQGGRARCLASPGLQGHCERAGWLEQPGDAAISLPNRLVLQIRDPQAGFDSLHF